MHEFIQISLPVLLKFSPLYNTIMFAFNNLTNINLTLKPKRKILIKKLMATNSIGKLMENQLN